jgi:hypothetical protein
VDSAKEAFGPDIRTIDGLVIWFAPDGEPVLLCGNVEAFGLPRPIAMNDKVDGDWLDRLIPF